MKKKILGIALGLAMVISSIGVAVFSSGTTKAEAATDYSSAAHITSYYSSVSGKGSSLLSSVCSAISSPYTSIAYGSLKDYYETTDPRGDGKLFDIYSDNTNYTVSNAGSSASSVGGGWNKEHTIPKSWWGGQETSQGCDIIIVRLSDIHCNSVRSNYLYGEVGTSSDNTIDDNKFGSCSNYSEIGVTSSTTVFEPRDAIKGDMARTYFYAVARYLNSGAGNGAAKNWTSGNGAKVFSSSGNNGFVQKYLNMLLRWHREDPVDSREVARNAGVESCQKNRNPFIDHPSWVDLIWGGTYPSTGTNYENVVGKKVSNGALVDDSSAPTLSSISVSGQIASFTEGDTFYFGGTVTAHYDDSTTADVTSSATFSGYNMSTTGNQTVTVSYGGKTTTYSISVNAQGGGGGGSETTYTLLTSIANIDQTANYVLGVDGTGFHYSGTSSWGLVALPSAQTPLYYTLTKGANNTSFTARTTINSTTYYLTVPAGSSNTFTMSTSSTSIKLGTTTADENGHPDYAVANTSTTTRHLRINGSSGLRSYAGTTGTMAYFYKVNVPASPTSITATPSKTFYVGDTITKSDIVVKDNLNNTISSSAYTFADNNHQFTFSEAASGGASTNKTFTNSITYSDMSCSLIIEVQRRAFEEEDGDTSTFTGSNFESAGVASSYTEDQIKTVNGITFNISGYIYSSKLSLSKSKTNAAGSVINTTAFDTGITNVTVSGASPDIQLSVNGSSGWVDLSSATTESVNYRYLKIFYKDTSQSNYVNITQIAVDLKGSETPITLSDYIMFEDTNNQCTTKFDVAKCYFENMSTSNRNTFMDSEDYVISQARDRLEKWAAHLGKTIDHVNGDYVISNSNNTLFADPKNNTIIVVVISVVISSLAVAGYFLLKNKKKTMN